MVLVIFATNESRVRIRANNIGMNKFGIYTLKSKYA